MAKKGVSIGLRPGCDAETWIQRGDQRATKALSSKAALYSARVTVDVTPALRARIKVAAIAADLTATELLRRLLEREFPNAKRPQ
jgi:hypothetical protein